jgi:hypothetical protein
VEHQRKSSAKPARLYADAAYAGERALAIPNFQSSGLFTPMPGLVQHMSVNHGRTDILVTKQFLDGANVVTLSQ